MKSIRTFHIWLGVLISMPLVVISITGGILMFRSQSEWMLPKTPKVLQETTSNQIPLAPTQIPVVLKKYGIHERISKIIIRPHSPIYEIRTEDYKVLYFDAYSRKVLKYKKRWASWLIALHEGKAFSSPIQILFFVVGPCLFLLILTGLTLFLRKKRYLNKMSSFYDIAMKSR